MSLASTAACVHALSLFQLILFLPYKWHHSCCPTFEFGLLAKDTVWENGGLNLTDTAAVPGKHPRRTACRAPGCPFVSGRRHGQWVPGSLCVKVVLKISETIVQTLYFWLMRVGNEYELIQAFAFLEFLENTGAFHGIQSNRCLAGGRQSCISLHMCCSLHGSPDKERAASSSGMGQPNTYSGGIAVVVYHHTSKCKYSDTQSPVS